MMGEKGCDRPRDRALSQKQVPKAQHKEALTCRTDFD